MSEGRVSRRKYIAVAGAAAAAAVIGGAAYYLSQPGAPAPTPTPTPKPTATPAPTVTPPPGPTATQTPTPTATPKPTPSPERPWEMIDWDKPATMEERLRADEYILPKGWKEATDGVEQIVFINSGGMKGDIATYCNMLNFEKKTGIKLVNIDVGITYRTAKMMSILSGRDPSVHVMPPSELDYKTFATANWLHPIDVLWPEELIKSGLFPEKAIRESKVGDHYYTSIQTCRDFPLFYRPSWLKAAGVDVPSTWKEYYDVAKALREWAKDNLGEAYYGTVFHGGDPAFPFHLLDCLARAQGRPICENDRWNLLTPEAKNAWKFFVDLIREDIADKACIGYTYEDYQKVFGMGMAGLMLGYSSYIMKFLGGEFPEIVGDWDVAIPPKWDVSQPDSYRVCNLDTDLQVINNAISPKEVAAAMLWIDYCRSKEATTYELVVEGNESFNLATYEDEEICKKVNMDIVRRAASDLGLPLPVIGEEIPKNDVRAITAKYTYVDLFPPGSEQVGDIILEYFGLAATGQMDPLEALEKVQEGIDKIFATR